MAGGGKWNDSVPGIEGRRVVQENGAGDEAISRILEGVMSCIESTGADASVWGQTPSSGERVEMCIRGIES